MILFTRHPDKAATPPPSDLRDAEFERVRGLYADGRVQQVWLRGDAGGACMDATADYTDEMMHAALEMNLPNYASAIVNTTEIVAAILAANLMQSAPPHS
jgi:hypothetical protein